MFLVFEEFACGVSDELPEAFYAFKNYYDDDFYCSHIITCDAPMSILPTTTTTRKKRRALNRLLSVGHRYRGDVKVAA